MPERNLRILQIAHYYPPETFGGTQSYVAELAAALASSGHEVEVVAGARTHSEAGDVVSADEDGIATRRVLRNQETERLSGDFGCERISRAVEDIAVAMAPDIVHVHHWHALSRDLVRRLTARGMSVVLTLHDLFTTCPRHFRMPDARRFCASDVSFADCAACVSPDVAHIPPAELERVLTERFAAFQAELEAATAVLTVSRAQRDFLCALPGFDHDAIEVLPIGIVTDEDPLPPPEPIPGRLRVVNWAGIDPRKGIHLIPEALAGSAHKDAFELHLHGRDGEAHYMDELREAGAGLDLRFHGPFEDSERRLFAARYDVAVLPFLAFETYGLVVDEALRFGIPVIVSDHGAPPERIGSRGITVPNGDVAALRRALEGLLDDPGRLREMRSGAHRARDLREHARELVALYGSLATKGPSASTGPA